MVANKVKTITLKDGQPHELSVKWSDINAKPNFVTQEMLEQKGYQNESDVNALIQTALNNLGLYNGEYSQHKYNINWNINFSSSSQYKFIIQPTEIFENEILECAFSCAHSAIKTMATNVECSTVKTTYQSAGLTLYIIRLSHPVGDITITVSPAS